MEERKSHSRLRLALDKKTRNKIFYYSKGEVKQIIKNSRVPKRTIQETPISAD